MALKNGSEHSKPSQKETQSDLLCHHVSLVRLCTYVSGICPGDPMQTNDESFNNPERGWVGYMDACTPECWVEIVLRQVVLAMS